MPCCKHDASVGQHSDHSRLLQAGYVHRDLRWDSVACSLKRRYFLLDLELCGKPGRPQFTLKTWPNGILQDSGAYTDTSDILSLGHMLSSLNIVTSSEGCAFLQQMWPAVPGRAVPTAEVLLCDT